MDIANCIRCNKVFQKSQGALCSDCIGATKGLVRLVIDFVLEHPGLMVEDVAQKCHLPLKDMEEMLFSGRLASASAYIMFKCQGCHKKMSARLRKGRFCSECAEKIESKVNLPEREPGSGKEKNKAMKRTGENKEDSLRQGVEIAASGNPHSVDGHAVAGAGPETIYPVPLEISPKQESVSPLSDSYGFKRVKVL